MKKQIHDINEPVKITTVFPEGYPKNPTDADFLKWSQWLFFELQKVRRPLVYRDIKRMFHPHLKPLQSSGYLPTTEPDGTEKH